MPNRIDLVVHYLACFKAGLIATPLNYRYTAPRDRPRARGQRRPGAARPRRARRGRGRERARRRRSTLGTIAYRDAGAAAAGDAGPGAHRCGGDLLALLEAELCRRPAPDPASPAVIFFTSGSTGPAKGVTHTRESLRWMIASAAAAFELGAGDVFLPGSSMSHVGSFLWTLSTLSVGGRVVVARTTDAHELLPLLREHQPTVLAMIPAALSALIRDHDLQPGDFASLRICRAGADKVSTELLTEFAAAAGFPIVEGYGMTEVGLATLNPPSGVIKQGSIGPPIGGFSIALRDEDGEPIEAGGGRPDLDPHRAAGWPATGRRRRRPPRSSSTAGSTPATSPAPTTTATSGSSAARSR